MATAPKKFCQTARTWLKTRNGKGCLGFLTGSTSAAFDAYVHLVDVWVQTRSPASCQALSPLVGLFPAHAWPLLAEVVAHLGDWDHVEELWTRIKPIAAPRLKYDPSIDRVVEVWPIVRAVP